MSLSPQPKMDNMEISHQYPTTSPPVASLTASHTACLSGSRLQIRCLSSLGLVRNIPLPQSHDVRNSRIAWSPATIASLTHLTPPRHTPVPRSNRVLVADDDNTRVYDLRDKKWNAVINNGSGGMGKNVHIEFGRTEDEVVIFSDFASKVSIWCLKTGRTVEIRDPKFSGKDGKGWGYRPMFLDGKATGRGGVMALLCRTAGQDILLLLAPKSYDVITRVELPTVDAAGLKWSKDGRWIAIWDAPSSGYHLHIYSADGHLYRTIAREASEDVDTWGIEGLGIKSVEWVPGNQWLAVGGWDRRVRILSTRTFSPAVFLDHTSQIQISTVPVYTEMIDGKGTRSYEITPQPATPPKATSEKGDGTMKQGISIIAFNTDGTLCATRDDSTPTTIWIWDLRSLRPKTILIQYASVKSLLWHPSNPALLLIQSTHDSPTVYLYSTPLLLNSSSSFTPGPPEILTLSDSITRPSGTVQARWDGKWLLTAEDKNPALFFGHQQGYVLVWPEGKDIILRFEKDDEEDSDDSLFDILTGRTPIPRLHHETQDDDENLDGITEYGSVGSYVCESTTAFDDTFREMRNGSTIGGRGDSVYDESGMDEMF